MVELGELFDHLVSTAPKNKKEEVDDYLGVAQQYLDILGESFLKDVKEVVRVVNSIIDKIPKQE